MPATVGATISGATFPLRHSNLGPFKSSAGNIYILARATVSITNDSLAFWKATDPMSSFTRQTPWTFSEADAVAAIQAGDVVHVVYQVTQGFIYWRTFDMSTDSWGTSETVVGSISTAAPTAGYPFVSIVVRSNGEVVVAYASELSAAMSGFNRVSYRVRVSANVWAVGALDAGGSINYSNPIAVLGAGDRVHFFYKNESSDWLYSRTLTAANALSSDLSLDTTMSSATIHGSTGGASYVDGANTRVVLPYADNGNLVSSLEYVSADSPASPAYFTNITDLTPKPNPSVTVGVASIVVSGTTQYLLYVDNTNSDLYMDKKVSGAAWGTDSVELTGTVNYLTANAYDRSGKKIAFVYDDAGTIKYAEITLESPPTPGLFTSTDNANANAFLDIVKPSDATGQQWLIVHIARRLASGEAFSIAAPNSNWTLVQSGVNTGGSGVEMAVFRGRADLVGAGPFRFTLRDVAKAVGSCGTIFGADLFSPIDVSSVSMNEDPDVTVESTGIVTTGTNRLLLVLAGFNNGNNFTPPTGMLELWDYFLGGGAGGTMIAHEAAHEPRPTAGNTGNRVTTFGGGQFRSIGMQVAIKPDVGAPDTVAPTPPPSMTVTVIGE